MAGLTCNWENSDIQYKNGIDSHLDWAASQFLSANWEVGIAGYVYYQLTGDSGSGARLGPFKSKVASIGPEVGYVFTIAGQPAYVNLRGYWEFWAENRLQGYSLFATLAFTSYPMYDLLAKEILEKMKKKELLNVPPHVLEGKKGEPSKPVMVLDMKVRPIIDADYLVPKTVNFIKEQAAAKKPFFVYLGYPCGIQDFQ